MKKVLGVHYRLHHVMGGSRAKRPCQDFGILTLMEAAHKAHLYAAATPGEFELVAWEVAETEVGAMPISTPPQDPRP